MEIQEGLDQLSTVIEEQHSILAVESTTIRRELEHYTDPLLQWVGDVLWYLGERYSKDPTAKRLYDHVINEMVEEGLVRAEQNGRTYDVDVRYNVEVQMDERTDRAMSAIREALSELQKVASNDPLVRATNSPETAPVVDMLRTMAEALGER